MARSTAPSSLLYLTEGVRSWVDFGLLVQSAPLMAALPRGDGHPVLVLPGLLASDTSTVTLRRTLRRLEYRTHAWRLGRNIGPTERIVVGMRERLEQLAARYDQPVTIVGQSLGGIYARQLARHSPESVRQVITLGSPIRLASTEQSRAHAAYDWFADRHVETWDLPLEHGEGPLPVPATSIYSRLDGIVAWQVCLDEPSARAENIPVPASHIGMGHHPAVLWAIADRLAQPAGEWAPFRPPPLLRAAYPAPGFAAA